MIKLQTHWRPVNCTIFIRITRNNVNRNYRKQIVRLPGFVLSTHSVRRGARKDFPPAYNNLSVCVCACVCVSVCAWAFTDGIRMDKDRDRTGSVFLLLHVGVDRFWKLLILFPFFHHVFTFEFGVEIVQPNPELGRFNYCKIIKLLKQKSLLNKFNCIS